MGRAPCCEKMGLKRGPWTPEEDQTLISYIHLNGHSNWRALPKLAGLSRCGKSCRLRWVNYLKPDIKRGNFTPEEEEAIIKLHELLGNRWSAIAARLPGRTDNEIKNIWHTHLKKRLSNHQTKQEKLKKNRVAKPKSNMVKQNIKTNPMNKSAKENTCSPAGSPQQSAATTTTTTTTATATEISCAMEASSEQYVMEIDESFWSENLTVDDFKMVSTIDSSIDDESKELGFEQDCVGGGDGEMDFWYDVLVRAGGLPELPEF